MATVIDKSGNSPLDVHKTSAEEDTQRKMAFGGATSTTVSVPSATSKTLIKAANAARLGAIIANDSTAIMYVLLGTGTPSASNYNFQLPAKGTTPADRVITGYTGEINAIWASANGVALVTEIS